MAIKKSNEITLKVISSKEVLIQVLEKKGFKEGVKFSLDDYYFIPEYLDLKNMTIRNILAKALIVRDILENNKQQKKIVYKVKKFNDHDEIIKQHSINCSIVNIEDGKKLLKAIGYREIMNIKENDIIYYKDDLELAIKDIENGDILIEVETTSNYDTVDKLKKEILKLQLPIQPNQYFIKKAEIELEKILNS